MGSRLLVPVATLLVIGCGSRSGLLSDDPLERPPVPDASVPDALVPDAFVPDAFVPDAEVPLPDPMLEPALEVSAGLFHSCAATRVGRAHCWGFNNIGQLGDGTGVNRPEPVASPGVSGAIAITAGESHSCALREGGTILCWGSNLGGQLGSGTFETRHLLPVPVDGLVGVASVDAGARHTCALTNDGRVFCWGDNDRGQVGPDERGSYRRPIAVPTPEPALEVSSGFQHTCARLASGSVICWGEAAVHLSSRPDEIAPPFVQTEVPGLPPSTQLTSGDFESCAVTETGAVYCWGFELIDDLDPETRGRVVPRHAEPIAGLDDALAVSAGHEFVCALRATGRVACWGENDRGQLGDGGADHTPGALVEPIGLPPSILVTSGWRHACALDEAGVVRCWGRDWEGQLGDGLGGEHRLPTIAGVFRD